MRLTMVLPQVVAVPDRNPVSPPELPGDAPVADILHPLGVLVAAALGDEPEPPVGVGLERRRRERRHPHEPLVREPWLDHRVAAITVSHRVAVVLLGLPSRPSASNSCTTRLRASNRSSPRSAPARLRHPRLRRHDVDLGQAVPLADLEVDRIVGRGHLDGAGAELLVDRLVGDDRDLAVDDRQQHLAADQARCSAGRRDAPPPPCRRASSPAGWWRR